MIWYVCPNCPASSPLSENYYGILFLFVWVMPTFFDLMMVGPCKFWVPRRFGEVAMPGVERTKAADQMCRHLEESWASFGILLESWFESESSKGWERSSCGLH